MPRKADPSSAQPRTPFAEFRLVTDEEREQELGFAAVASVQTLPVTLGLSREQRVFLMSVAQGNNYTQSAHIAGVARSTFYHWQKYDHAFIAAMNAWRDDTVIAARNHLLSHVGKLVEVVLAAGTSGDVRIAMTVLKSLGVLSESPAGATSHKLVRQEAEKQALKEGAERARDYTEYHKALSEFARSPTGKITKKLDEETKQEASKAEKEEEAMLAADEALVKEILANMPEEPEDDEEDEYNDEEPPQQETEEVQNPTDNARPSQGDRPHADTAAPPDAPMNKTAQANGGAEQRPNHQPAPSCATANNGNEEIKATEDGNKLMEEAVANRSKELSSKPDGPEAQMGP